MLRNHLTTAYRHLLRYRTTTLMNVISLSVGIMCCLVVYVIVKHEYTYDDFQPQADWMYRIVTQTQEPSGIDYDGSVCFPMAELLREEIPAVASATQTYGRSYALIKRLDSAGNEARFQAYHTLYADSLFFQNFHYPVVAGHVPSLLRHPNEVVLTRPLADRVFGSAYRGRYEALVGQRLEINQREYYVSGVLADIPDRTNLYFHLILPMKVMHEEHPGWTSSWKSVPSAGNAFFTLSEGYSPEQVETTLNQLKHRYLDADLAQRRTYYVQALSEVHTDAQYGGTFFAVPSVLIGVLILLAFIVLLTGSINFINLSTAQSIQRSKEIGIRKVMGGQRRQLISQFLGEAGLQVMLASLVAVGFAEFFLDSINDYMAPFAQYVVMQFRLDTSITYFLIALVVLLTLLAGSYPAWVLTRYRPVEVLKQSVTAPARVGFGARFSMRKGLIVGQFVIAQFLLIGTLVTAAQMRHFYEQDMGFTQENIMMVDLPEAERTAEAAETFRQRVLSLATVQQVSLGSAPPASRHRNMNEVYVASQENAEKHNLLEKIIDPHYLATFDLALVAGRSLHSADYVADSTNHRPILLNEQAVRTLGFTKAEAALGQIIRFDEQSPRRLEVVGVVADFVNNTLKERVDPGYFYYGDGLRVAHIQFTGNPTHILPTIEARWASIYPDAFFQYEFLDEHIALLYTLEDMLYRFFRLMAGLALAIGCLGLYGLASYLTLHRRKEIGIRKTLGATVRHILLRFTREFSGLVLLAFLIAAPLGYFAMRAWLDTFAYRIDLHLGFFGLTLLAAVVVAWGTVGYQAVRAAIANPVDSLRDE